MREFNFDNTIEAIESKEIFMSIPEVKFRVYLISFGLAPFITMLVFMVGQIVVDYLSKQLTIIDAMAMILFMMIDSVLIAAFFLYLYKYRKELSSN